MYCRNCGNQMNPGQEICLKCGCKPLNGDKFCQNCGADVSSKQEICIKCGVRLEGGTISAGAKMVRPATPPKGVGTAAILSFLITGLGQIYLGQTIKGIAMLIGGIIIAIITGLVAVPVIWIISVVDAYKIAKKLQSGQPVGEWEFF